MIRMLSLPTLIFVALAWFAAVGAVPVPQCQNEAAPSQMNITLSTEVAVPAPPFGIVYATQQTGIAFVALGQNLGVLDTSNFTPRLIHQIPLPSSINGATGIALTPDGLYVLVTTYATSVIVIDTTLAATGGQDAVVGTLNIPPARGTGAIEVTVTRDKYAFVSLERGPSATDPGSINVFKLQYPNANGTVSGIYIGSLTLNIAVVGSTLSPDGSTLYAASESRSAGNMQGTISIINVARLKTAPTTALISTAIAGCNPTRVVVSQDGQVVWVTARASNYLLAFEASKLETEPNYALLASVQVGTMPDNLIFFRNETRMLLANSNRKYYPNATAGLGVIDVEDALRGEGNLGQLPTGFFPREFALSPDGTIMLVSVYGSNAIQAVNLALLP